jgi:hypothetical protein
MSAAAVLEAAQPESAMEDDANYALHMVGLAVMLAGFGGTAWVIASQLARTPRRHPDFCALFSSYWLCVTAMMLAWCNGSPRTFAAFRAALPLPRVNAFVALPGMGYRLRALPRPAAALLADAESPPRRPLLPALLVWVAEAGVPHRPAVDT